MLFWEWRRLFRQKWRSLRPVSHISYAQYTRRRLIVSFILFFIGWKVIGVTITEKFLYTTDESTGKMRYFEPGEMRSIVSQKRVELDRQSAPAPLTLDQLTVFALDDSADD